MNDLAIAMAAAPIDLGDQTFDSEAVLGDSRNFGIIIENNTNADVLVTLFDDYKGAGTNVVTDGTIITGVTATSTGSKTIAEMKKYFSKKPARVVVTQFESNSESQLTKMLLIDESSIFGDQPQEKVNLAMFKDPANLNNKLINVKRPYQMDDETKVSILIPKWNAEGSPTRTTINFFFGAIYNQSRALYNVAKIAGAGV